MRTYKEVAVFPNEDNDRPAHHLAQNWCRENGYSYGSTQRRDNIGIKKGDWNISKWRDLWSAEELLDGFIGFSAEGTKIFLFT